MLTMARAATLVLRSFVANGRRPNMWHSELMLHVAWCNTQTRTRPAQNRALNAAPRVPPSSHPSPNGRASDTTQNTGKSRVDHDDVAVGEQVGGMALRRVRLGGEQPADVGVPQSFQLAPDASPVVLRRVRIRSRVSEDVVPAVIGHPTDRSPLVRHRAERDEDELERSAGGERPVGEKPMEADRDAVTDEQVEHRREEHVPEVDAAAPEADHAEHTRARNGTPTNRAVTALPTNPGGRSSSSTGGAVGRVGR